MKKGSIFFNLLLISFLITITTLSFGYGPKTGRVPALIGIVTLVFALLSATGDIFPHFGRKFDLDMFNISSFGNKLDEPAGGGSWSATAGFLFLAVWLLLFYLSVFLIGFIFSIPLFLFLFIKIYGKQPWLKSLCSSLASWVLIYAIFVLLMKFELFKGILRGDFL